MNKPTTREAAPPVPAPRTEPDQAPAPTITPEVPAVPAQRRPETIRRMQALRGI